MISALQWVALLLVSTGPAELPDPCLARILSFCICSSSVPGSPSLYACNDSVSVRLQGRVMRFVREYVVQRTKTS